ncbi:transposase [Cupriavidus necator]|uniref:Transposase n=1 Tax=Cupriavidus necator TaxID=106590 RepID=A0A1U9V1M6_CUPNE|nr:transposase [Cupriavidus necator]
MFNSRPLPEGKIKDGTNFSRDARGNWFLNIVIEVADTRARSLARGVGIDLGLKDLATLSTGEKVANPRHLGQLEQALAKAQRARKKRLATNLHARIANARRDFLHKLSHRIVRDFDYIAVGNVNAAGLAKTRAWRSPSSMRAGRPSAQCSRTRRLRMARGTRKSTNVSPPRFVLRATRCRRRGRKVSQTLE